MYSRRKRLDKILQTGAHGGVCDVSVHDLRCLYSKEIPEEEETVILKNLRPDARAIHQRFLREEKTQEDEKLRVLAENAARDSMMEEARGDDAETIGGDAEEGEEDADDEGLETYRDAGATGGDAEKGEKDADDESVETNRDAGTASEDAEEGKEDADDEDIETDREAGGVAFATKECVNRSIQLVLGSTPNGAGTMV